MSKLMNTENRLVAAWGNGRGRGSKMGEGGQKV